MMHGTMHTHTHTYIYMLSHFSGVLLFATLWTVACQDPLPMGFSRQEYWSGLSFPLPGDLPNPGIKPTSFMSPALSSGFITTNTTWEVYIHRISYNSMQIYKSFKIKFKQFYIFNQTASFFLSFFSHFKGIMIFCISLHPPILRVL